MTETADELDRMADQLRDMALHHSQLSLGLALAVGQLVIRSRYLRAQAAAEDEPA